MISATRFTFIVEKSWKNMNFYSKMVWPPPPYDVISRNHRNLPLLNLTQNAREGWTNSYWKKIRCWCFIVYEKIQKNFSGGWHPLHVQGLKQTPLNRSQTVTGTVQTTYWRTHEAKKKNNYKRMTGQPTIWPTINDCLAVTIDWSKSQWHYESS